jgi:hypothetical protein
MEMTSKIRKLIYGMFDTMIEGADKYVTKSSTWLIFTDEKKWVLEFTKEKVLWFNYGTFQSELVLVGMDCVDSKDVIKEWFESRFLGIEVEDTIQNGVKHTSGGRNYGPYSVEETIQNGVKHTFSNYDSCCCNVEDTIQNGVKETIGTLRRTKLGVDDIIKNGVKEINHVDVMKFFDNKMEAALQNGIKETKSMCGKRDGRVNNTIENGVKATHFNFQSGLIQVEDVIQNGVKLTLSHFGSFPPPSKNVIKNVIQNGVKDTLDIYSRCEWEVKYAIKNGVRHVEDGDWLDQDDRIDDIIQNGVKS